MTEDTGYPRQLNSLNIPRRFNLSVIPENLFPGHLKVEPINPQLSTRCDSGGNVE